MKEIIKILVRNKLNEAEFNYHVGNLGDDLKNIKPYGSDNIIMMRGRGTGHFGSGVYFSTYSCTHRDKMEYEKEYGNIDKHKKELTEFPKAYRVDFDIYQNLFRVKSNEHAEMLFRTLKLINESFYLVVSSYDSKFEMDDYFSTIYLKIKNNTEKLGLNIPKYRDYIRMIQQAGKDMKDKTNLSSMSTRIMEYNGFNGVNVSGISMYDNTLHGSVIYDMSKISTKPIPVKNPDLFCKIKNDVIGSGDDYKDIKLKVLRGEETFYNNDFNTLPEDLKLFIVRRVQNYIHPFTLDKIDDKYKKIYYNTLPKKIKSGLIQKPPSFEIIRQMIKDGYMNIIYNPDIKFKGQSLLEITFEEFWRFDEKTKNEIINGINRELTPEEEEGLRIVKN